MVAWLTKIEKLIRKQINNMDNAENVNQFQWRQNNVRGIITIFTRVG
jgi:hypothetical protein